MKASRISPSPSAHRHPLRRCELLGIHGDGGGRGPEENDDVHVAAAEVGAVDVSEGDQGDELGVHARLLLHLADRGVGNALACGDHWFQC